MGISYTVPSIRWTECRFSLDGITTLHTTVTITNRLRITLNSTQVTFRVLRLLYGFLILLIKNFRTLIPEVRLRPLNFLSASSVNLHGLANINLFHNNLRLRLTPLKSPVLRKYSNPFKRPGIYPNISK